MIEIFTHPDHGRVEVIRQMLADSAIASEIRDDEKGDLIPGIPIRGEDPVLCVKEEADEARAKTLIAEYLAAEQQRAGSADWVCAECGEKVPGNFDSCWKCDALRPGAT